MVCLCVFYIVYVSVHFLSYCLNLDSILVILGLINRLIRLDHVKMSSDVGVGVSLSSLTIDCISARQNGQCCSWDAHVIQKPLQIGNWYLVLCQLNKHWMVCILSVYDTHRCVHGSNRAIPFRSKHKVHESSRTLNFRNCSRNKCRGSTTLSCSFR